MTPSKRSSGKRLKRTKSALKHRKYEKNLRQRLQNGDPAARGVVERRQEWQRQYQAKLKVKVEDERRSQTGETVGEEIQVARRVNPEAQTSDVEDGEDENEVGGTEPAGLFRTPTPLRGRAPSKSRERDEEEAFNIEKPDTSDTVDVPPTPGPEKPAKRSFGRPLCTQIGGRAGNPRLGGRLFSVIAPSLPEHNDDVRRERAARLPREARPDMGPVRYPWHDSAQRFERQRREEDLRARLSRIERKRKRLREEEVDVEIELRQLGGGETPE